MGAEPGMQSLTTQLVCQALLIGGFKQTGAQHTVDLNGTADYSIRKLVEFHLRALPFFVINHAPAISVCEHEVREVRVEHEGDS